MQFNVQCSTWQTHMRHPGPTHRVNMEAVMLNNHSCTGTLDLLIEVQGFFGGSL